MSQTENTQTETKGNVSKELIERKTKAHFIFAYLDACARERKHTKYIPRHGLSEWEQNRLMNEARSAYKTGLFTHIGYVSPRETGILIWHDIIDGVYNGLYVSNNYGLHGGRSR